ncbi:hypothetical protein SEA_LONELYSOIL_5 [Microbacterium phage Lonelysoil]|nr:hypothetical protein SEA_LONELYSOIL_5 [Microbacterium phage Lonelysoil]
MRFLRTLRCWIVGHRWEMIHTGDPILYRGSFRDVTRTRLVQRCARCQERCIAIRTRSASRLL